MRKKTLIVILGIVLILGGLGLYTYNYLFNRDVTADEIHADADFFDFSGVLDPGLNTETNNGDSNDKSGDQSQNNSTATTDKKSEKEAKPVATKAEPISKEEVNKLIDGATSDKEKEISEKYASTFVKLQSMAVSKLDILLKNAKKDYKGSDRSKSEIASIYMSAAKKLEKSVDGVFYDILGKMKQELKDAGLSTKMADKAEEAYKSTISKKKSEMMDKALS
ncbi:hypothetical protein [Paenibacillus terrigena]|uniref:hypothetical protein n=1 Tax=Paenibacillus terrigena TaxID=369333 RepID=UPI0003777FAA|nr:hypothetical protein [Paenibacillus terrigena]